MAKIICQIKEMDINGKPRPITLYSRDDLKKQKELYARYAPFLAGFTHSSVYSFIPGFSNFDAAAAASHFLRAFDYFMIIDIQRCYPSMRRDLLFSMLLEILREREARVICGYVFCCPEGISEGSPLPSAMSNIYLRDFDQDMSMPPATFYLRYCDGILFLSNIFLSNISPAELFPHIENALLDYGLPINSEKFSAGLIKEAVRFLGYVITANGIAIKPEKAIGLVERLRGESNPKKRDKMAKGFKAYYRSPIFLSICEESLEYLGRYGKKEDLRIFNGRLNDEMEYNPEGAL
ncbi:MAG: hypothetical protein LBU32_33215 [Clostridiales bacterium]|nr:hypothetical protein [Clostridiales bacterium]